MDRLVVKFRHYFSTYPERINSEWNEATEDKSTGISPTGRLITMLNEIASQSEMGSPSCLSSLTPVSTFSIQKSSAKHPKTLLNFLRGMTTLHCFPKVHAETVKLPNEQSDHEQETTMDKLLKSGKSKQKMITVTEAEVQEYIKNETGMERVKMLFEKSYDDHFHPQLSLIGTEVQLYMAATFIAAAVYGGKLGRQKFIDKHVATKWTTKFLAARAAQDAVFMGALKQGFIWTTRMGIFSSSFLLIAQTIASYRNKTSPLEYSVAAGITASILRYDMGIRGMAAAGMIGTVLGFVGGLIMYFGMKSTGETQDKRHFWYITEILENQKSIDSLTTNTSSSSVTDINTVSS